MNRLPILRLGCLVFLTSQALRAQTAPPAASFPTPGDPSLAPPPAASQPPAQSGATPAPFEQSLGPYQRPAPSGEDRGVERPDYMLVAPLSWRRHDGLYLRLAGGLGTGFDSLEGAGNLDGASLSASSTTGSAGGFAGATEVAIGASPIPGWALGAGIYTTTISSPSSDDLEFDVLPGGQRYEFTLTQLALFAIFSDVYPMPDTGFHVQGGAGLAVLVMGLGTSESTAATPEGAGEGLPTTQAHTALGPGMMLGVGYEWWIGNEWSLGALARFTYAWTSGDDGDGVSWEHQTGSMTLLAGFTYH
jgi:hypothetical protein